MKRRLSKGYLHVYTGNSKGKTTAALGLAFRALGYGYSVRMLQFLKGPGKGELGTVEYGEWLASEKFGDRFIIEALGRPNFVNPKNPDQLDVELAKKGVSRALEVMGGNYPDILILDELTVAFSFKLIDWDDIEKILYAKPGDMELIITGRDAPQALIQRADLVTEMKQIKHYYERGIKARQGIEF
ncbi:MAG: cob(I)yrinic acid a,c-diamide adenosyltransferase [Candidatus Kryptoniota bacterium]